jgi:chromosome segregation ATPase
MSRGDAGTFLTAAPGMESAAPTSLNLTASAPALTNSRPPLALPANSALPAPGKGGGKVDRGKALRAFVEKHCRTGKNPGKDVEEEWTKVDDKKIAELRGILSALQEENQSTQLLKKESQNAEARRELEATRSGVEARLAESKRKENAFIRKQADLLRHVKDSEKSLQELETNIEKAEKKCREEVSEGKKLDVEVAQLEKQLREQEAAKENEQKKILKYAQYKKYLEVVVGTYGEYEGDIEVLMNRYTTLAAGNRELHETSATLTKRLDERREESTRVQTELQNEHLMLSSNLHACQVELDKHRADSVEMEQRLNRALEEKELKESQVGVIQMAIDQLFQRTVSACQLKQRRKAMLDAIDIKFAPVRGDKADIERKEMLKQITERIEDLKWMYKQAQDELSKIPQEEEQKVVFEGDIRDRIKVVQEGANKSESGFGGGEESETAGNSSLRTSADA